MGQTWKELSEFGRKVLSLRRNLLDLVSGPELGRAEAGIGSPL